MSELRQAAQAVVDRWDTPLWKDAPHTAEFIDRLRAALAAPPMSKREQFEAYFAGRKSRGAKGREKMFARLPTDDTYADDSTQRHWWTWQNAIAERERFEININESVRVKLTELGRRALERQHAEFLASTRAERPAYEPPEEDAEGWSEWQLWCLMQDLGHHCGLGRPLPFETTIQVAARPRSGQAASGCDQGARSDVQDARAVIEQCRDALAEEMAAWDIDPKISHVLEAHAACERWLAGQPEAPTAAPLPKGWNVIRKDDPLKTLIVIAPNGYSAVTTAVSRNPENVLRMLVEDIAHPPARSGAGSEEAQPDRSET